MGSQQSKNLGVGADDELFTQYYNKKLTLEKCKEHSERYFAKKNEEYDGCKLKLSKCEEMDTTSKINELWEMKQKLNKKLLKILSENIRMVGINEDYQSQRDLVEKHKNIDDILRKKQGELQREEEKQENLKRELKAVEQQKIKLNKDIEDFNSSDAERMRTVSNELALMENEFSDLVKKYSKLEEKTNKVMIDAEKYTRNIEECKELEELFKNTKLFEKMKEM